MGNVIRRVFPVLACVVALGLLVVCGLFCITQPEPAHLSGGKPSSPMQPDITPVVVHAALVDRYPAATESRTDLVAKGTAAVSQVRQWPVADVAVNRMVASSNAIPGEWILRFRDGDALQHFVEGDGLQRGHVLDVVRSLNALRLGGLTAEQILLLKEASSGSFEYSPNFKVSIPGSPGRQDPAKKAEQQYAGFGLRALPWLGVNGDHGTWGSGIRVAILDVGVGQCPGVSEKDIVRIDLTGKVTAGTGDANSHATAVAVLLAGGIHGVEGVAPSAQILSIKVLSDGGSGDSFTLAKGIEEAVSRGARIINLSLGSRGDCPLVRQAVERAVAGGVIVVAAVGNDSAAGVSYPAAYNGVLGVTAVDAGGRHLDFANTGPGVDLAAPGFDVWAAYSEDGAMRMSGTSAAVPLVAGALASLISKEPGMTAAAAVDLLLRYCDDAGMPGRDEVFGCGILDMRRVLDSGTRGIRDIAIVDNCMELPAADAGQAFLVVSVQNRGTERLPVVQLRVRIGEYDNTVNMSDIEVGESVGCRFSLRPDAAQWANGVRVVSEALIPGVQDDLPWNNLKISVFGGVGQASPR